MKKLGFGLMRLPLLNKDDAASIDVEQVKKMVDVFMEKGFTYFDTAWMYHSFKSENAVKEVLTSRYPRNSYTIATKLHSGFVKDKEDCDKVFDAQREKTGVDYFDYYLIHNIDKNSYSRYGQLDCFNWLADKKKQGLVKKIGFSFHADAELLDKVLTEHPEMEFVQLQINYLDWDSEWIQSGKCYEVARQHGKPVIVMEPVKGGTLAQLPVKAEAMLKEYAPEMSISSWAIRFAASLDNVFMVLSGMSDIGQMMDNLSYMEDFKPLDEEEQALIKRCTEIINDQTAIGCTGCDYCMDGCPQDIAISKYFSLYNAEMRELESKQWTPHKTLYEGVAKNFGKAGDCIECGACESICPQHLQIIDGLKKVSARFDS